MKKWGARRGLLPTLNHLIALEATARLGSFRAAADEMSLTQGAVAQQVRALEQELGCQLFDRLPRGLSPNRQGKDYINRLRLALGIIDEATRELRQQDSGDLAGRLTLSTTPTFASRWLIPRLPLFARANPDIAVMIDASETVRPLRGSGHVDMTVRWGTPPFEQGHACFLLPGSAIAVCAPALLEGRAALDPARLHELPLISDSHNNWKRWFEIYANPEAALSGPVFSQTSHAIEAAEQGMGVALVPSPFVEAALERGVLVKALDDQYRLDSEAGFYILTADAVAPQSHCARVIDWLLAAARGEVEP
ncbi:LysR substrate-binding domain-containing protein [Marinobacterium rhizophilum]|uniref:LysR family transcriptional regulator n=1 Tax=Marinobacterium rhizophilum TaxID=420402 RepID=A0ABY5HLS8_9GAMM|nr:LysR substrate-binding domain-containing protein [Marinobacterium rhizophilum]UTW13089.1 LysR family transcriptional regulator [Marinobacterium rhizophilum]